MPVFAFLALLMKGPFFFPKDALKNYINLCTGYGKDEIFFDNYLLCACFT